MKPHKTSISALVGLSMTLVSAAAAADTPTLYLGSYGGSTQEVFQSKLLPKFEKEHNVKIVYIPGNSSDTLAKLQAQKNAPEMDVVLLDEGPMYQAVQFGFCDKIDKSAPVYKDLYSLANLGPKAVALGTIATGLFYNTEAFKKKGYAPPTSWFDLANPKFKQKIVIPPINNTYGLQTLIMFAKLNHGGEKNIAPGFNYIIKKVNPNVLAWEPSPGTMTSLFQNQEAILGVWGSGRVEALKETGFPVKFVYPKEGAMALQIAICPIVKSNVPKLSQELIQYLLSPQVQQVLAKHQGWGPVNKTTKLSPDVAAKVPYGPAAINSMLKTDWDIVNPKRAEWTSRWNRTVER